jgi:UDP-glucose:(heptosyl)LPS alpha-1,3-glucosyltransferase
VICTSNRVAKDVVALYGIDESVVRMVRNGVSDVRFRPDARRREEARRAWAIPDGGRALLFLGHGFERKGLQPAAEGFVKAARAEDRLIVMGDDRRAARWRSRLGAMLGEKLVWWGPADHPEHWLPGADASILPTRYDAGANTTLESLAAGVPPIVSAMDGNAEVVPFTSWVLPEGCGRDGVASAIDCAWSAGRAERERCVAEAKCWSVERNVTATEAVYREVCDG